MPLSLRLLTLGAALLIASPGAYKKSMGSRLTCTPSMTHRNSGTRLMLPTAKSRMYHKPCNARQHR